MEKYLKQFFASPMFEHNEDETNRARVLNSLLVSIFIALGVFVIIDVPFFAVKKLGVLVTVALAMILLLFVRFLISRGQVRLASIYFLTGAWLIFTAIVFLSGGIAGITPIFFLVTTVLASLLLGQEGAIGVAVISSVTALGMVIMEIMGYPPPNFFPMPAIPGWITLTLSLAITILPLNLVLRTRAEALALARQELAERRRMEEVLRRSEERYRNFIEQSTEGIWMLAFDEPIPLDLPPEEQVRRIQTLGYVAECNDALARMYGYTSSRELIGVRLLQLYGGASNKVNFQATLTLVQAGYQAGNRETQEVTKNGETVYFLNSAVGIIEAGQLVALWGTQQDITALKKVEQALRASEERYRIITELISDYTYAYRVEPDGSFALEWITSDSARRMTGYDPMQEIGSSFILYHPDDQARANQHVQETLRGKPTGGDYRIITKAGELRWVHIDRQSVWDPEQQRVVRFYGVSNDITERKQAEVEREKLIAELEAKNAELERFTYTVSHDLKAPLVTIKGFLGWLQKDLNSQNMTRVQLDIERIQEATEKMHVLLDELLELSRIGRLMNQPENIPFATIVQEALALVAGRLAERGVKVEVAEELPLVYGDRARLVEVVQNLVDNAAKFMGNQPQPLIKVGMQKQEGEQVFFVRDNGIGIAPQYYEKVFGLFNQLDPHSEGTGIGLALVKRIVEVHGRRIWVESDGPGQGSTFYFSLQNVARNLNESMVLAG